MTMEKSFIYNFAMGFYPVPGRFPVKELKWKFICSKSNKKKSKPFIKQIKKDF